MILLAALPSSSVALVIARSASHGTANGLAASAGIVSGDLVFIIVILSGLSALANTMGSLFLVIKFIAAAYLVWLGVGLLRSVVRRDVEMSADSASDNENSRRSGLLASYVAGLLLTLGDIKAIFFYMSLLPGFIDMVSLDGQDIALVCLATIISVGGVKAAYALLASRLTRRFAGRQAGREQHVSGRHARLPCSFSTVIQAGSGCALVGAGCYLVLKN